MARKTTGIRARHARNCKLRGTGKCSCRPSWEASVGSGRDGKIRRVFPTEAAAKAWRAEALVGLNKGALTLGSSPTVRQAGDLLIDGMRDGTARTRSGRVYKPSVIRGYEQGLRIYVYPELAGVRLSRLRRVDVQRLADRLHAGGADPSTVRNAIMPLRVVLRRALEDGVVAVNVAAGLRLPAVEGKRDRIATPSEAERLIGLLRPSDRALWGCAAYGGLRAGELRALDWSAVDLAAGVIRVEQSMDHKGSTVAPKSDAGRRSVPIPGVLRDLLITHKLETWSTGYVFGSSPTTPFTHSAVIRRAKLRWAQAKLAPIGLHELRHGFASLMIAAGVNAKALSTYMGHSSISITLDRYGHLFPGAEAEAAGLLDAYLQRADTAARVRQLDAPVGDDAGR
jgi:integrase